MREDVETLQLKLKELRIENVNQVQLRVAVPDSRFLNSNILTCALINNKPKVLEFFLENNMIDLYSCCAKSVSTLNALSIKEMKSRNY